MVSRLKDAAFDLGAAQFDRVRDVVTWRLDRTCEQLSRVSGPMRDLGLNPARKLTEFYCPLDSIRAVSLGLLDKTEAILDSLDSMAAERVLAEHLAERLDCVNALDCGKSEDACDETSSCTSRSSRWSWVDSVPRVLSTHVIRTFSVRLSRSSTLKVTGLCLQEKCAAVMRRLRVADAQKLFDNLVLEDVKQQLMIAAKDRSAVAAATVAVRAAYLTLERLLGDSMASRLLARATGKLGAGLRDCVVGKDMVLELHDDPNTSESSAREHAVPGAAEEREIRQGTPVEFRLIVKNSFIELDETPGDLRRARSWPDESWDIMRAQTLHGLNSGPFTLVGTWEPLPETVTSAPSGVPAEAASEARAGSSREAQAVAEVASQLSTAAADDAVDRNASALPSIAADKNAPSTANCSSGLVADSATCTGSHETTALPILTGLLGDSAACTASQTTDAAKDMPISSGMAADIAARTASHLTIAATELPSPTGWAADVASCTASQVTSAPSETVVPLGLAVDGAGRMASQVTGTVAEIAMPPGLVADRAGDTSSQVTSATEDMVVPPGLVANGADFIQSQANCTTVEVRANLDEVSEVGSAAVSKPHAIDDSAMISASSAAGQDEMDESALDSDENRTTVMLRNIPREYSPAMVLELLDNSGFARRYTFFYLPVDFTRGAVLGYALVCCRSPSDAAEMLARFQGFDQWVVPSSSVCEASWSQPRQSLRDHIERYRSSPVMHPSVPDEYKPALFKNGEQVPFPAPTKAIRRPRVRHVRPSG